MCFDALRIFTYRKGTARQILKLSIYCLETPSKQDGQCWETKIGQEMLKLTIIDLIGVLLCFLSIV